MSIYKVKFRCVKCNNLWIEDVADNTLEYLDKTCPECGGDEYKLSFYNDNIANIDDEIEENGGENGKD